MMASTASLPTPSHIKIDSTMAVPPRRLPTDIARRVRIVTRQDRRTLFQRVTENRTPRALAPVTYALSSSSSTVALTCLRYLADMAIARVRVGRAALCRLSPVEITGNTGKQIASRYISTSATKKFGRLFPMKLQNRIR